MRTQTLILLALPFLVACQTKVSSTATMPAAPEKLVATVKPVDFAKHPGMAEQYRAGKFSVGYWANQKPGQIFQSIKPQNPNAAVVYLYRPNSRWNRAEAVAPNFFLNGERIPSLINNHYYWMELPEGQYRITLSRPLGVLHFQKPKVVDFSVKSGQQYFLKYEEESFRGAPDENLGLLRVGPFMQMPTKQGLSEIRSTQLKSPGLNFVAVQDRKGRYSSEPQKIENDYKESDDLAIAKRFKLWNPLTW